MTKISFSKFRSALFAQDAELNAKLLSESVGFDLKQDKLDDLIKLKKDCLSKESNFTQYYSNKSIYEKIDRAFYTTNLKYKYFPNTIETPNLFKELYIVFASLDMLSSNDNSNISLMFHGIYELMVLFKGESSEEFYKNLDKFFSRNYSSYIEFRSLRINLKLAPCKDYAEVSYDLPKARNLLNSKKDSIMVAKNFHMMPSFKKIPNDSSSFKEKLFKIKYPEAKEDPELAKMCDMLGVENFDSIIAGRKLGFVPTETKPKSSVPEMHLQFNSESSSYHMVKLPEENPRAQQLGNYVGNCMSWPSKEGGDNVNSVVFDAMHRENMGIYAIIKSSKKNPFAPQDIDNLEDFGHEFIGESPVWIGSDNSINLGVLAVRSARAGNLDIQEIMQAFGEAAEEKGFDRIVVGGLSEIQGIRNFDDLQSKHTKWNSVPVEGYKYAHILHQQEAYISTSLLKARGELKELTGYDDQSHIISVKQAEAVKAASLQSEYELDQETYVRYSSCYVMRNWDAQRLLELVQEFEAMKYSNPELYEKLFNFSNEVIFTQATPTKEFITYKYGITIEDIYKLPEEVIDAILNDNLIKDSIVRLSDMSSIAVLLKNVDSILSLKRSIVKAYGKDLSKEEGDLSFVDEFDEGKCDKILESAPLFLFGFTNIKEISYLSDDVFEYITSNIFLSQCFVSGNLPKLQNLHHNDLTSLRKEILDLVIKYKSSKDSKYNIFGDSFVNDISSENLELLTNSFGLNSILASNNLQDVICYPKEDTINIQKRIMILECLKYSSYELDRSDINTIRSLDEDICNYFINSHPNLLVDLVMGNILSLIQDRTIKLSDIKSLDWKVISLIYRYLDLYKVLDDPISFLKSSSEESLSFLESNDKVLKLHKEGKLNIQEIVKFDIPKIQFLTNLNILEEVDNGNIDFAILKNFDSDQLEVMYSFILGAVLSGRLYLESLQTNSVESLKALRNAIKNDFKEELDLDHLRCQSPDMINAITKAKSQMEKSNIPLWQYELANHSAEKIDYIFSFPKNKCSLLYFLKENEIDFIDFMNLPLEYIKVLLGGYSNSFRFKEAGLTIDLVKDMELQKLELILSDAASDYILSCPNPTKLSYFVPMDIDGIRSLLLEEVGAGVDALGDIWQ